jgi:hypothetical protein
MRAARTPGKSYINAVINKDFCLRRGSLQIFRHAQQVTYGESSLAQLHRAHAGPDSSFDDRQQRTSGGLMPIGD